MPPAAVPAQPALSKTHWPVAQAAAGDCLWMPSWPLVCAIAETSRLRERTVPVYSKGSMTSRRDRSPPSRTPEDPARRGETSWRARLLTDCAARSARRGPRLTSLVSGSTPNNGVIRERPNLHGRRKNHPQGCVRDSPLEHHAEEKDSRGRGERAAH
eukprot:scaffold2480_cov385-Prasinococcus_capsulatus_cf.AAC.2